jgi:hypothetical protein
VVYLCEIGLTRAGEILFIHSMDALKRAFRSLEDYCGMKRFPFIAGPHNVLLYGACIGIVVASLFTGYAFVTADNFSILGSELICEQPLNNRCVTRYKVIDAGSSLTRNYEPSGYLFQSDDLETGNQVLKQPFSFTYFINGQERRWNYGFVMLIDLLLSVVALVVWYRFTKALR